VDSVQSTWSTTSIRSMVDYGQGSGATSPKLCCEAGLVDGGSPRLRGNREEIVVVLIGSKSGRRRHGVGRSVGRMVVAALSSSTACF
jgi:hypothetical protein